MITDKCNNSRSMCESECPDSSRTLGIIHEFRKLYEDKMRIIDTEGSGDCHLQAKLSLQHDWIRDLNDQNEMLVRAVEELEQEATERVVALEEKLRQSSKCACEVMNSYKDFSLTFQHISMLQEDVGSLVAFIKRSFDHRTWNIPNLKLHTVQIDLNTDEYFNGHVDRACPDINVYQMEKLEQQLALKDSNIKMIQDKLDEAIQDRMKIAADINKECTKCAEARQSMLDMRDALTAEVADKHDVILTLKRDVQVLEEQCKKADQQTHFKDDIIKELRKEIKQLKLEKMVSDQYTSKTQTDTSRSSKSLMKSSSNTYTAEDQRYSCPIKEHRNLEMYKDFHNRIVIFVCEDCSQQEVLKIYDGCKLNVDYRNRRIVHEYETAKLQELYDDKSDFRSSLASIPSIDDECIFKLKMYAPVQQDIPEKLELTTCYEVAPSTTCELVHSHPAIRNKNNVKTKMNIVTHVVDNLNSNHIDPRKKKNIFTLSKKHESITDNARSYLSCKDY